MEGVKSRCGYDGEKREKKSLKSWAELRQRDRGALAVALHVSSAGSNKNPHRPALISPRIIHLDWVCLAMWGLFNYLWKNAARASAGMQQCALWNLWTADCKRERETLRKGRSVDGRRVAGEKFVEDGKIRGEVEKRTCRSSEINVKRKFDGKTKQGWVR